MKAFILDKYKKKGAMRFGDMPEPALGQDDVLVEIHAAGLNPLNASRMQDISFLVAPIYYLAGECIAFTERARSCFF